MTTATDVLVDSIESWLTKKTSRNLSMLAKTTGISYATLRRVTTRENPASAEVAARIAGVTLGKREARSLLAEYFPNLKGIFGSLESDDDLMDERLERFAFFKQPLSCDLTCRYARGY